MRRFLLLGLCMALGAQAAPENGEIERKGRIGFFDIVQFPNDACRSDDSTVNGTCYTGQQCEDRDGIKSGSCADGFGVCCIFKLGCGGTSRENNTLIQKSAGTNLPGGQNPCTYKICPMMDNICRIKLDFRAFEIAGPVEGMAVAVDATTADATIAGNIGLCSTDTFTASAPGRAGAPLICGYNTGQHMILDAVEAPDCHELTFSLGEAGINRIWDIAVTQYTCPEAYDVVGGSGCLQFFTGTSGQFSSFNFPTGTPTATTTHLQSQTVTHCFRQEQGYCGICYTPSNSIANQNTFGISTTLANIAGATTTGGDVEGSVSDIEGAFCRDDFVQIPGAQDGATNNLFTTTHPGKGRFCGRALNFVPAEEASVSVCSATVPFQFLFVSNDREEADPTHAASVPNLDEQQGMPGGILGYRIDYALQACV